MSYSIREEKENEVIVIKSLSGSPTIRTPFRRAVGRSENPGMPVLFGGHNLFPLVEIGSTDLPKTGSAMAPPAPPSDDRPASP